MKYQINFRASDLASSQLDWLMAKWGTSQTETLTVVIDRIYQQERIMDARKGTGPLRQRLPILKPFAAEKGETTSMCCIDFERCNHCGAIGWGTYAENVWGMDGDQPVLSAEIIHAAQPLQHKPGCPGGE